MTVDTTFNPLFHTNLFFACGKMGELYYVDKALEFLASSQGGGSDEFSFDLTPEPEYVNFTIGTTYPVWVSVRRGNDPQSLRKFKEEAEARLKQLRDEGATKADELYAWVEDQTKELTPVWPMELDDLAEGTTTIANSLGHDVAVDFGGLTENLGAWRGQTRDAFVNDWYTPFKDIRANHFFLLGRVSACYAVARGITAAAQHGLSNVVIACRDSVELQLLKRMEDNSESPAEALGLASGITGFLSAVTFALPPVSVSFGVISATTGLAAAGVPPESAETIALTGETFEDLQKTFKDAVGDQVDNWTGGLDELSADQNGISSITKFMDQFEGELRLYPRAPGIREHPNPAEFHHDSSKQY